MGRKYAASNKLTDTISGSLLLIKHDGTMNLDKPFETPEESTKRKTFW